MLKQTAILAFAFCAFGCGAAKHTAVAPSIAALVNSPIAEIRGVEPSVTQENIQQTICVSGWSKTRRPSRKYINRLRPNLPGHGEIIDHIIALELGGSNAPENLQLQTVEEARRKDEEENYLHRRVCRIGDLMLRDAQILIYNYRK